MILQPLGAAYSIKAQERAWSLIFTDDPKKMYPASDTAARRAVSRSSTARSTGPRSTAERAGTIADAFTVTCKKEELHVL